MGWVNDIIRNLLWAITSALLQIGDAVFEITQSVGGLRISEYPVIWRWWNLLSITIGVITAIRIVIIVLKYMLDDEYQQKINMFSVFIKVLFVAMAIGFLPIGVRAVTDAGASAITNMTAIFGNQDEMKPSSIIISSVIGHSHTIENQEGVQQFEITYTLDSIADINTKEGDEYFYFKNLGDIFIVLIMGAFESIMFVLIGIQIAQRLFALMMKILVAPIPISGLVNPEDTSFQRWYRMIISDVVSNFAQLLLVFLVMSFSSSNLIRSKGAWVTIVIFLGGIMATLTGIPELASIIGGDTSTAGVMQQLASIRQASSGVGRSMRSVGRTLGGVAKKATSGAALLGAGTAYGIGRAFGAKGFDDNNTGGGFSGGAAERQLDKQDNMFVSENYDRSSLNNQSSMNTHSNLNDQNSMNTHSNLNNQSSMNTNENIHTTPSYQSSASLNDSQKNEHNKSNSESLKSKPSEFNKSVQKNKEPNYQFSNKPLNQDKTTGLKSQSAYVEANKKYGMKSSSFVQVARKGGSHVYKSSMNYLAKRGYGSDSQKKSVQAINAVKALKKENTDSRKKGGFDS